MCMVSTPVNDNPLPSVENAADDALNEANVNRLKPTKFGVLPEPILALCCIALFDDCEEQRLRFVEVELWRDWHINLDNPLKFSKEILELHIRLFVLGPCVAVNRRLILMNN
jgi:hypothetical protein